MPSARERRAASRNSRETDARASRAMRERPGLAGLWLKASVVLAGFVVNGSAATAVESDPRQACPADMVLVTGQYCLRVKQECLRWLDPPQLPFARCAAYASPARCLTSRIALQFCIDRHEYTPPGTRLPLNFSSFVKAAATCAKLAKRVCSEEEWNFACEGEEMRPYPYGFTRKPVCNQDRYDLYEPGRHQRVLRDLREPSGDRPECLSPFGVYDMVGNLDEPVRRRESSPPFSSALKGGWWMPARNRCRPATTAHGDYYGDIQVGVRCCAEALD